MMTFPVETAIIVKIMVVKMTIEVIVAESMATEISRIGCLRKAGPIKLYNVGIRVPVSNSNDRFSASVHLLLATQLPQQMIKQASNLINAMVDVYFTNKKKPRNAGLQFYFLNLA
jgi:hypothetical protein